MKVNNVRKAHYSKKQVQDETYSTSFRKQELFSAGVFSLLLLVGPLADKMTSDG